jgi:hypothetical protein
MRRATLLAGLILGTVLAREAAACSCASGTPASRYASSDIVFRGTVLRVTDRATFLRLAWTFLKMLTGREPDADMNDYAKTQGFKVELDIRQTWRGPRKGTVTLFTGRSGGDCGIRFVEETEYLVYGDCDDSGDCYTFLCNRTRPVDRAGDDLRYLASLPNDMRPREK